VSLPTDPFQPLRSRNTSLLLEMIWGGGKLSRADLARHSGLARSTVSAIVNPLIEADVLQIQGIGQSNGGRPPEVLRFNTGRFHLVGVELGAAHVAVILTDLAGNRESWATQEFPVEHDPDGTMTLIHKMIARALDSARVAPADVLGVGVAVPCPIHPDDPNRLSPQILPRWRHIRMADAMAARHGWPVFVDNDANMGAVGEQWWGAGRGVSSFAYIKVATGVGAGLVFDGAVYTGPGGIAGEIGHTAIDARGPRCRCGLYGCLEAMVGTRSLESAAAMELARHPDAALGPTPAIAVLVEAAQQGHPLAAQLIARAGELLGVAIANLVNLVNPTRVILGGRLPHAGDVLIAPLLIALRERAMWSSVLEVEVVASALGDHAIALGAATRVLHAAMAAPELYFPVKQVASTSRVGGADNQPTP
jgi:predicted NBD/HSP70 family sugar kinase